MATQKILEGPVLGLDLSKTNCGWAWGSETGVFVVPKGIEGGARLALHRDHFCDLLERTSPVVVVLEDYTFQANLPGARDKAETHGVIRLIWEDWLRDTGRGKGHYFLNVSPTTIKAYVKGGTADKSAMELAVYKRWGFEAPADTPRDHTSDVVDAFAIGQFGLLLYHLVYYPNDDHGAPGHQVESVIRNMSKHVPELPQPLKQSKRGKKRGEA